MRKDQARILKECLNNDEPVFVLRGRDACAIPALNAYLLQCIKSGCSVEFLKDLKEIIDEFNIHHHTEMTKIPD